MAGENATRTQEPIYLVPWTQLVVGLAMLLLACLIREQVALVEVRVALLVVGTVLCYAGVVRRLQRAGWDFQARVESAAMVSVSGLGAFAARYALAPEWTSAQMFFLVVFLVTLIGAILVLLPSLQRRVLLSLIVLFHLAGIVTAVTVVDPPNSTSSWISRQLMARVYRPYLSFIYMTNAYHFYSPEPGTPGVFWIAVYYSDGKYAWLEIPRKADSPIGMHYQRMLALPEHSFNAESRLPFTDAELRRLPEGSRPLRGSWEEINRRRLSGSMRDYQPDGKLIPMVSDLDVTAQYQQPTELSQKQISSVARHLFTWPAALREDAEITSIKIYRVRMSILSPYELANGMRPGDRTKWMSFFLGEFDSTGRILHPRDPFLYWYLPILKVPSSYPRRGAVWYNGVPYVSVRTEAPKDGILLDCLEMHAATPSPQEEKEDR